MQEVHLSASASATVTPATGAAITKQGHGVWINIVAVVRTKLCYIIRSNNTFLIQ